jgi:hypothetical protein
MTVLEPTPDRAARAPLLRRASFVSAAVALTATFGVALSGIASTRGSLDPDGQAAAVAAARQQRGIDAGDTGPRHHCRRAASRRSGGRV